MLQLSYILYGNEQEQHDRAKLFIAHGHKETYRHLSEEYNRLTDDKMKDIFKSRIQQFSVSLPEIDKLIEEEKCKLCKKGEKPKNTNWSFLTLKRLCELTNNQLYSTIYSRLCQFTHPNINVVGDFSNVANNQINVSNSASSEGEGEAVYYSLLLFLSMLKVINDYCKFGLETKLKAKREELVKMIDETRNNEGDS